MGKGKRDRDPKRVWLAGHPHRVDALSSDPMGRVKECLESPSRFHMCM